MLEGETNVGSWIGGTIGVLVGLFVLGWLIRYVLISRNQNKLLVLLLILIKYLCVL